VRTPRAVVVTLLLLALVLALQEPVRRNTLAFLRLPFTAATAAVRLLLLLPRLPSLPQENARLVQELIEREQTIAQLRASLRQVTQEAALHQALPVTDGVTASVIGRSLIPTQHTILLNRGQRHGVAPESIVVDASGVIGRVVELHPTTALVMLLTDPESRIAGVVERSRESGLLVGQAGGQCVFLYLDVEAEIQEGDRIVTAGLGGPFPQGLALGLVSRVVREAHTGTAWATVRPLSRPGRLEIVRCLPPSR